MVCGIPEMDYLYNRFRQTGKSLDLRREARKWRSLIPKKDFERVANAIRYTLTASRDAALTACR